MADRSDLLKLDYPVCLWNPVTDQQQIMLNSARARLIPT